VGVGVTVGVTVGVGVKVGVLVGVGVIVGVTVGVGVGDGLNMKNGCTTLIFLFYQVIPGPDITNKPELPTANKVHKP